MTSIIFFTQSGYYHHRCCPGSKIAKKTILLLMFWLKISIISVFLFRTFFFISTHSNHSVFFPGKIFFSCNQNSFRKDFLIRNTAITKRFPFLPFLIFLFANFVSSFLFGCLFVTICN